MTGAIHAPVRSCTSMSHIRIDQNCSNSVCSKRAHSSTTCCHQFLSIHAAAHVEIVLMLTWILYCCTCVARFNTVDRVMRLVDGAVKLGPGMAVADLGAAYGGTARLFARRCRLRVL